MNKQELIKNIYGHLSETEGEEVSIEFNNGYEQGCGYCIALIEQLDEPEKVVVPKFVAEWYESHKDDLEYSIYELVLASESGWDDKKTDMRYWIQHAPFRPLDTLIKMQYGYEVEKDQLYKVIIDHKYLVQLFSGRIVARLVEFEELTEWHESAYKLTESVIKAIDERYWAFAVEVED